MKESTEINQPIKNLSAVELRRIFDEKPNAFILRSIIINERDMIKQGIIRYEFDRTLRGFWYSTVKPVLDKLGKLEEVGSKTDYPAELSRYCKKLNEAGELLYSDLKVVDESRSRDLSSDGYSASGEYLYQASTGDHTNIILACEKETVYPILRQETRVPLWDLCFVALDTVMWRHHKDKYRAFLYCDPPYLTGNTHYHSKWSEVDFKDLITICIASGMKFAISEFNNNFVVETAISEGLKIITLTDRTTLKNRNTEILLTNYETNNLFCIY